MKAIDLIRGAMAMGDGALLQLAEDMRDAPLTAPTPRGGNHPMWVLGHIAFIESNVPNVFYGEPNPVAHWAALFAPGTEPMSDASAYPSYDEVMRTYKDAYARNVKLLDQIGEAGLDTPTKSPPRGLEKVLSTVGQTFLTLAMHKMTHRGQLCDARRAIGRKPIFTPGVG